MTLLRRSIALVAVAASLAGCGTGALFPDRTPDASGVLAPYGNDATATYPPGTAMFVLAVEDDDYAYFADAVLSIDADTVIGSSAGDTLELNDLAAGVPVEVWTGACQESYPVQCDVTHVRVLLAAAQPPVG